VGFFGDLFTSLVIMFRPSRLADSSLGLKKAIFSYIKFCIFIELPLTALMILLLPYADYLTNGCEYCLIDPINMILSNWLAFAFIALLTFLLISIATVIVGIIIYLIGRPSGLIKAGFSRSVAASLYCARPALVLSIIAAGFGFPITNSFINYYGTLNVISNVLYSIVAISTSLIMIPIVWGSLLYGFLLARFQPARKGGGMLISALALVTIIIIVPSIYGIYFTVSNFPKNSQVNLTFAPGQAGSAVDVRIATTHYLYCAKLVVSNPNANHSFMLGNVSEGYSTIHLSGLGPNSRYLITFYSETCAGTIEVNPFESGWCDPRTFAYYNDTIETDSAGNSSPVMMDIGWDAHTLSAFNPPAPATRNDYQYCTR
jgi:hypothetical protein